MRLLTLLALLAACAPSSGDDGAYSIDFEDDGKADDGSRAVLPACASPLFERLFRAARKEVGHGTVPARLLATAANRANPAILVQAGGFAGMADLVEKAEYEVDLQTYSWRRDSARADELLAGLTRLERARRAAGAASPVVVRILVDTMTTFRSGQLWEVMPALAGKIEALALDPDLVKVELATYHHAATGSLHSKSLVVDGRTAVVGSGNPNWDDQRDMAFQVEGDVALALLADFDDAWSQSWLWTCGSQVDVPSYEVIHACAQPIEGRASHVVLPPPEEVAAACLPMLVSTRDASSNPFSDSLDNPQDQVFLAALAGAASRVRIETPNLNDDDAKQAVLEAVLRGVTVEMVLSKKYEDFLESLPGQGGTNAQTVDELYEDLAAAGLADPCARLRVRWYASDAASPVVGETGNNHVKYLSADGQLAIVGSANMDTQSWNKSREVNVVVDDAPTVAAWDAALFAADFARAVPVEQCR